MPMRKTAKKIAAAPRPSKSRKAHTYRAARRNFARTLVAARIEPSFRSALRLAETPYCDGLREFCAANPNATPAAIQAEWNAPPKPAEPEPAPVAEPEAPKAKKPRTRKPAAPKDATAQAAPKAPRKTAAKKPTDAATKPKAAPRKRAPAAA